MLKRKSGKNQQQPSELKMQAKGGGEMTRTRLVVGRQEKKNAEEAATAGLCRQQPKQWGMGNHADIDAHRVPARGGQMRQKSCGHGDKMRRALMQVFVEI